MHPASNLGRYYPIQTQDKTNQRAAHGSDALAKRDVGWKQHEQYPGFRVFSAYYDDRRLWRDVPVVAVLGLMEGNFKHEAQLQWSLVLNNEEDKVPLENSTCYHLHVFPFDVVCVLQPLSTLPPEPQLTVEVAVGNLTLFTVPVVIPLRPAVKQNLNLCFKGLKWSSGAGPDQFSDVDYFIGWVEMQRVLGVDHITINNASVHHSWDRVIDYYVRQGFVDLTQSYSTDSVQHTQNVIISDCVYRHMHSFHYTLVIDVDELVVPEENDTLADMLQHVIRVHNISEQSVVDLRFDNRLFCHEYPFHDEADGNLHVFLQHRKHKVWHSTELGHWGKAVTFPQVCLARHPHYCDDIHHPKLTNMRPKKHLWISGKYATVHHYRHCLKFFKGNETKILQYWLKDMYVDNRILHFKLQLESQINITKQAIELENTSYM